MFQDTSASVIQSIADPFLKSQGVDLCIKRDDLLHKDISGNKWRKLKYNIRYALDHHYASVLTFGGAYSNHIVATAAAAREAGLGAIGIIRGEEADESNPTLSKAKSLGMRFKKVSRSCYREKNSESFSASLQKEFGRFYRIPEGGSNQMAVKGVTEMLEEVTIPVDYIVAAVGTGATIAGLINGAKQHQEVLGIPVLKGGNFLKEDINSFLLGGKTIKWSLNYDYHFNGYAKFNEELIKFINSFYTKTGILLDPIYTGKMMYGVYSLIGKSYFRRNTRILAIHTGGLQGIAGFNERFDQKILF